MQRLTDDEQLAEIERLVEGYRGLRERPGVPGHRTYVALKAVAAEIRGRMVAKISETERELGRALTDLEASRTMQAGVPTFSTGCMDHVAMQVRRRWPTIRQALAFFEDARKADAQ